VITFELPWLPPSANHAYFNHPKGGRVMTKKGKKFKIETTTYIVQHHTPTLTRMKFAQNHPYGMAVYFHFPNLENKGFLTGEAKTRYKKLDASNRLKLLEDAVVDALGIDDSQFTTVLVSKVQGDTEKTLVTLWCCETESFHGI